MPGRPGTESSGRGRRSLCIPPDGIVAVASLLVARLFRLPESDWPPITALVIGQSSQAQALTGCWRRFLGTVLGAALSAIVASQLRATRACVRFRGVHLEPAS